MVTDELMTTLAELFECATKAEAMGIVSAYNDAAGSEMIEIDGPDAYWNGE